MLANDTLIQEYQKARLDYLKAVVSQDENLKIQKLKKVIELGDKLNKDTTPDRKKLEIFQDRIKKESTAEKTVKAEERKEDKKNIQEASQTSSIQYPIKDIFVKENEIIIQFNKNISEKDINKFELNSKNSYKDVFDIKGYYPKARDTFLKMNGLDKITVGQFKPDTFRVVLKDNKKIDSYFKIQSNNSIAIKVANATNTETKPKISKNNEPRTSSKYVDTNNSIREIFTEKNSLTVLFNDAFNKKMVNYAVIKHRGKYIHRFDVKGVYKYANPIKLSIKNLDKVTIYQKNKNQIRIDLINDTKFNSIYIVNNKSLVIKLNNLENKSSQTKTTNYISPYKDKVIVIDAGHGGKDVGAVGPKKRYEKDVVLAIAKYAYEILKQRGYKVYLTRKNDRFIKVMDRTKLANKKNADIFLSIHANSIVKSKANKTEGIETFFLSPARSERAKRVAAIENKSDVRQMSNSTKNAFLESLSRPRITASHKLSIDVQAGMLNQVRSRFRNIEDSGVREGPFWVLVGAQMPSILIEVGYISHPKESARLVNKEYQKLLARGIANGIEAYFSKNP